MTALVCPGTRRKMEKRDAYGEVSIGVSTMEVVDTDGNPCPRVFITQRRSAIGRMALLRRAGFLSDSAHNPAVAATVIEMETVPKHTT